MVSSNKIIARPKIFAAMVCWNAMCRRISRRMSRTRTRGKPKYQRWQRLSFNPRIAGRLTRLRPQSSPFGLPVCVTGVPAAPLCETPSDLARDSDPTAHLTFVLQIRLTEFRGEILLLAKDHAVMKNQDERDDKEQRNPVVKEKA